MSKTSICNRAISRVGGTRLLSIDSDDSPEATACRDVFEDIRDTILEAHQWGFAQTRETWAASAEVAPLPWVSQFLKPSGCVALCWADSQSQESYQQRSVWALEGAFVRSLGGSPLYVRYTDSSVDISQYSPGFTRALVVRLAAELAIPIAQSRSLFSTLMQEYDAVLDEAIGSDIIQGVPQGHEFDQLTRPQNVYNR